jgi:hypothetical protein
MLLFSGCGLREVHPRKRVWAKILKGFRMYCFTFRATVVALLSTCALPILAQTAAVTPAPATSDSLSGTTFNTPSASPANVPGANDLAGIGKRDTTQETIFTEPVSGLPIRFDNGIFVYPSVLAGVGYNSNIAGTSTNPQGSSQFTVQPRVVGELKKHGDRYTLTYNGNFTRYSNSSTDNFNNNDLTLAGDNYFSARSRMGWSVGYVMSSDPRGSTDRPVSTEPDRWTAPSAQAIYAYGAKGAQGRFEVEAGLQNKRYQNNRAYTVNSDVDSTALAGRFFYRIMPKTAAVFEVRRGDARYVTNTGLNNTDTRYLVGVTWDSGSKTTGTFKVGHQNKSFSNAAVTGSSGATWEGGLKWSPLTYSTVELTTGRSAVDSSGFSNYAMNDTTNVVWNHKWASYLTTRATVASIRTDYSGTARSDSTRYIGLGVFYEFGRNMRAGFEYGNTNRSSDQSIYDFKRNTSLLSLEATL